MVAKVTKGFTYLAGSDVTTANTKTWVESATVASISRSNIKNAEVHVAEPATAPPPGHTALEPWQHSTSHVLITKLSNGNPAALSSRGVLFVASGAVEQGDRLQPVSTNSSGVPTMKAQTEANRAAGVCLMDAADGENSLVVFSGVAFTKFAATVVQGDGLSAAATDGKNQLLTNGVAGDGLAGIAVSADTGGQAWVSIWR